MSKCYVYRYMVGDQWIYVGKANNSLHDRIRAHAKEKRFEPYLGTCEISYFEFNHESDMSHSEAALIKIMKPVLNISGKNDDTFPFLIDTNALQWVRYKSPKEIREEKAREKEEEKRRKEEERRKKLEEIEREKRVYRLELEEFRLKEWCKDYLNYVEAEAKKMWSKEILEQIEILFGKSCENICLTLSPSGNSRLDDLRILNDMSHSEELYKVIKKGETLNLTAPAQNAVRIVRTWTFAEAGAIITCFCKYKCEEKMKEYGKTADEMFALYEKTKEELAACA